MNQHTNEDERESVPGDSADTDGVSRVFRAFAVLRGVRRRHKGKLDLSEAISEALEQGDAFRKWRQSGTSLKRVQVWAEDKLLITVALEDVTDLKSVHFGAFSFEDAILQVVKADEGEEPVVLFNVPLNMVRSCGFNRTIDITNGQRLRVVMGLDAQGRIDMVVACVPEEDACPLPPLTDRTDKSIRLKTKTAGAVGTRNEPWKHHPLMIPQPRLKIGAWACAFIFLIAIGYAVRALTTYAPDSTPVSEGQKSATSPDQPQPAVDRSKELEPSEIVPTPTYSVTVRADLGDKTRRYALTGEELSSCPAVPNQSGVTQKPAKTPIRKTPSAEAERELGNQEPVNVKTSESEGEATPTILTAWDTQSEAKLAAVRYVLVKIDDSSPSESSDLQKLHTSFVRVLNEKSRWEVIGSGDQIPPEAVIKLRFEPDRDCLGVVLIEIREPDGKLLWHAFVGGRALPKQDATAMFADASARLISKLQDKLDAAQNSATPPKRDVDRNAYATQ